MALLVVGSLPARSQPLSPSGAEATQPRRTYSQETNTQSKTNTQSNTDKRGTEKTPLIVKVLPTTSTLTESGNNPPKSNEESSGMRLSEAITAIATIFMAIFTGLLWRSTQKLWEETKASVGIATQSANAAEKTADAVQAQERAYVFIQDIALEQFTQSSDSNPIGATLERSRIFGLDAVKGSEIYFSFQNYGRTPAILKEVNAAATVLRDFPASAESLKGTKYPVGFVLAAREKTQYFQCDVEGANDVQFAQVKSGEAHFLLYGRIRYSDVFRKDWVAGFCWEYDPESLSFGLSHNEQLNYGPHEYRPDGR